MKKISVVVDNYKLKYFESQFTKAGFVFTTSLLKKDLTTIFIVSEQSRITDVAVICEQVEAHFREIKSRKN